MTQLSRTHRSASVRCRRDDADSLERTHDRDIANSKDKQSASSDHVERQRCPGLAKELEKDATS
jgi:hypothetical protein